MFGESKIWRSWPHLFVVIAIREFMSKSSWPSAAKIDPENRSTRVHIEGYLSVHWEVYWVCYCTYPVCYYSTGRSKRWWTCFKIWQFFLISQIQNMIHSQKIDHRSVTEHDGHSILLYVYCIYTLAHATGSAKQHTSKQTCTLHKVWYTLTCSTGTEWGTHYMLLGTVKIKSHTWLNTH